MDQHLQQRVYNAVQKRGYVDGWGWEELALRQLFKSCEEFGELFRKIENRGPGLFPENLFHLLALITRASSVARNMFDLGKQAELEKLQINREGFVEEAADVVIPLLVACEALGFDLLAEVERKALADIGRGVRGKETGSG